MSHAIWAGAASVLNQRKVIASTNNEPTDEEIDEMSTQYRKDAGTRTSKEIKNELVSVEKTWLAARQRCMTTATAVSAWTEARMLESRQLELYKELWHQEQKEEIEEMSKQHLKNMEDAKKRQSQKKKCLFFPEHSFMPNEKERTEEANFIFGFIVFVICFWSGFFFLLDFFFGVK